MYKQDFIANKKFRRIASQLCGALPYYCFTFGLGTTSGFGIILIAELSKNTSEIPTTLDELTWIASLNFLSPIGTLATGLLAHHMGNRIAALIEVILCISTFSLYYYATNVAMIFASRTLMAFTAVKILSTSYISEISEPEFRGSLLVISQLTTNFGYFFNLLLGTFMYWRHIALVNLVFPIFAAIIVIFTPNSPIWLANRGRLDEAEKALCWLRGWVQPSDVQNEYRILVDSVQQLKSSTNSDNKTSTCRTFFQHFFQRSFYLPLGTIFLIFSLHFTSGVSVIQTYSSVIFRKMNSPIAESTATAIMGALGVIGNCILLIAIKHAGKRKLAFFSLVTAGFCYIIITTVGFLNLQDKYPWVSPIAFIIAIFANAMGIESIVFMIVGEIFPASVRYIGTSIGISISTILSSSVNKSFLYVLEFITLPGVFLLFVCINFVAFVTYYFVFPETEGKSLKEIEDHYKGSKKRDTSNI